MRSLAAHRTQKAYFIKIFDFKRSLKFYVVKPKFCSAQPSLVFEKTHVSLQKPTMYPMRRKEKKRLIVTLRVTMTNIFTHQYKQKIEDKISIHKKQNYFVFYVS